MFGGDVHWCREKYCRYFDVEPRIVPLQPGKYTIGPDDVSPHIDENTTGVAAVLGTTFTGHKVTDLSASTTCCRRSNRTFRRLAVTPGQIAF